MLWRSKPMVKTVTPGPISVSVWQEISSEAPKEVRQSNDGRWELRIYKASYEVIDRRTGDLVIRRAGTDPAFSPTQRFLVASTGDNYDEIIDLAARRVIRQHVRNFIVWLHEDSIALENWGRYCNVIAIDTLVDETKGSDGPVVGAGAGACNAWDGSQVDLSIDAGYIANSSTEEEQSYGAYGAASLTRLPVASEVLQSSRAVRIPWMQANFDKAYAGPPRIWRLHDSLKLVSSDYPREIDKSLRPYMMSASHVVSDKARCKLLATFSCESRSRAAWPGARTPAQTRSRPRFRACLAPGSARWSWRSGPTSVTVLSRGPARAQDPASRRQMCLDCRQFRSPPRRSSCDDDSYGAPNFVKAGDAVFEVANIGNRVSQVAYWPGSANDLVVLSFDFHGTDDGTETTRILRRQGDGRWLSDCRHKTAQPTQVDDFVGHEGEIPPVPFRFPSGDVALLYVAYHQLLLSPAVQSDPDLQSERGPGARDATDPGPARLESDSAPQQHWRSRSFRMPERAARDFRRAARRRASRLYGPGLVRRERGSGELCSSAAGRR